MKPKVFWLALLLCAQAVTAMAAADGVTAGEVTLKIPAPSLLRYEVQGRVGFLPYRASGTLRWMHDGRTYASELAVNVMLLGSRTQSSRGRITPDGLQPQHFSDRVRDDRSVDFDYRDKLIRFSEGSAPSPLPAGAQDHLSVFMQLGSLIGSAPERYPAGTEITLPAMGIYGPETWRLLVRGEERLKLPGGELTALRLTRPPSRPDDPSAEVWLAPSLGWLPARIRLTQGNHDFVDQMWLGSETP